LFEPWHVKDITNQLALKLQISNLGFVLINVFSSRKIRKVEGKKKWRKGILILAEKIIFEKNSG